MKHTIKQNLRQYIVVFAFLLVLSLTAIFILSNSDIPEENPLPHVVSGILTLEEGRTVPFANNEGTLRLINSTVGFPQCADCMETAMVEVVVGNQSAMLNYRFGGIAGFHDDMAEAFGYRFFVNQLLDDSVTIEYEKIDTDAQ